MTLFEDSATVSTGLSGATNSAGKLNYVESQTLDKVSTGDGSILQSIGEQPSSDEYDADKTTENRDLHEKKRISFEDFIDLNDIVFEWSDSYDTNWKRLATILAPTMMVDYSIVGHERIDDMPADEFVGMMSSTAFLGDPLVKTQHLMGARRFEYLSDTEILGHHQIRAAHQRYAEDGKTVVCRGHGHSFIGMRYKKVAGVWKLSGLRPQIYWNEKDFDKIFVQLKGQR